MPAMMIPFSPKDQVYHLWARAVEVPCPSCDEGQLIGKDGLPVDCGRCSGTGTYDPEESSHYHYEVIGPEKIDKIEIDSTGVHVRANGNWHTAEMLFTDPNIARSEADERNLIEASKRGEI